MLHYAYESPSFKYYTYNLPIKTSFPYDKYDNSRCFDGVKNFNINNWGFFDLNTNCKLIAYLLYVYYFISCVFIFFAIISLDLFLLRYMKNQNRAKLSRIESETMKMKKRRN